MERNKSTLDILAEGKREDGGGGNENEKQQAKTRKRFPVANIGGKGGKSADLEDSHRNVRKAKGEEAPATTSRFKSSRGKRLSLAKLTALNPLRCFERVSIFAWSRASWYTWLVIEVVYTLSGAFFLRHSADPQIAFLQALSACAGGTGCRDTAEKRSVPQASLAASLPHAFFADAVDTVHVSESTRRDNSLRIRAQSTSVGEGFHRTMLTTVHIEIGTGERVTRSREEAGERGRLQENVGARGRQADKQIGEVGKDTPEERGTGERREASKESEEDAKESAHKEGEEDTRNKENTRKGHRKLKALEGVSEDGNANDRGRIYEKTRRREAIIKEQEECGVQYGAQEKTRKLEDEDGDLICIVTCEYGLDKIVYVDPDQTWELGLKGRTAVTTDWTRENKLQPVSTTDFAHMGLVEIIAPFVDLEAPVFAPHLSAVLRVRQTIGSVLLKRSPRTTTRIEDSHVAPFQKVATEQQASNTTKNASNGHFSPFSSSFPFSSREYLHEKHERAAFQRKAENIYEGRRTRDESNEAEDSHQGENKTEDNSESGICTSQNNGSESTAGVYGCTQDKRTGIAFKQCGREGGSGDAEVCGLDDYNKFNDHLEAVLTVELPFHHRYDAACSDCGGYAVHRIRTPVVKVVCCREYGERKAELDGEIELPTRLQENTVTCDIDAGRTLAGCCYGKGEAETQHHSRSMHRTCERAALEYRPTFAKRVHAAHPQVNCISAKTVASAAYFKQTPADFSLDSADTQSERQHSAGYKGSSSPYTVIVNSSNITRLKQLNATGKGCRQANEDALEENANERSTQRKTEEEECKTGCEEDKAKSREFIFQVPVGSAGDLPWVTVLTMMAVGASVLITAQTLGYVERQAGNWSSRKEKLI